MIVDNGNMYERPSIVVFCFNVGMIFDEIFYNFRTIVDNGMMQGYQSIAVLRFHGCIIRDKIFDNSELFFDDGKMQEWYIDCFPSCRRIGDMRAAIVLVVVIGDTRTNTIFIVVIEKRLDNTSVAIIFFPFTDFKQYYPPFA
jgi:hypothetical protein